MGRHDALGYGADTSLSHGKQLRSSPLYHRIQPQVTSPRASIAPPQLDLVSRAYVENEQMRGGEYRNAL